MAPTNAEEVARQLRRNIDHELRGLAYFDSFEDLERWKEADVNPLQKSNTPLLKRPDIPASLQKKESSNVMLMHDYKNGYLENGYEGCQGAIVSNEDYILEQWQRVEAFNYFTHYRVSIPPPTWVNTGHRNGALMLGTFCIEGANDHPEVILKKGPDGKYLLANILARMAACYGFDGYLMNIEVATGVSTKVWDGGKALEAFLNQLREGLKSLPSGGKVIWYDALTKDDRVNYQNTLNADNVAFAKAAGSISTNYWWTPNTEVGPAVDFAKDKMRLDKVYFGVDCWGQTNDGPRQNTRNTFGIGTVGSDGSVGTGVGHGGTATGLAVKQLAPYGLGSGIFACGWAYEHFSPGRDVDRYMWEGTPDLATLKGLNCACVAGSQQHIRPDFKENPITKFAKQYPAGSEGFFHTDYKEAISSLGSGKFRAHLGQQSILPAPAERSATLSVTPNGNPAGVIAAELKDTPSRCSIGFAVTDTSSIGEGSQLKGKLILHKLNARGDLNLDLVVTYQRLAEFPGLMLNVFAVVGAKTVEKDLPGEAMKRDSQILSIRNTQDRITAIGIAVKGPAQNLASLFSGATWGMLDVFQLTLRPTGHIYPKSEIHDVKLELRGKDATTHHMLSWSIPKTAASSSFLPFSTVTGSFSHFVVSAEGKELGRAYALAFVIDKDVYKGWKEEKKTVVSVVIVGHAFDGSVIGSFTGTVHLT